jgi:glucosamine-6-phosphate deaminase
VPDAEALGRRGADRVAAVVARQPSVVIGLPTGRTPRPVYAELARRQRAGEIDLSRARFYQLDEYVGTSGGGAFRAELLTYLFAPAGLPPLRLSSPDGRAVDVDAEACRYDARLRSAGGFGLVLLGIGVNGHVAFNEPGDPNTEHTRVATLAGETRTRNAALSGNDVTRVPERAITVGLAALRAAGQIIVVASDIDKATVLARSFGPRPDPMLPAAALAAHPDLTLLLTRAAAGPLMELQGADT